MSFFSFRKPKVVTTLQEQGGALVVDVRRVLSQAISHAGSLFALLRIEAAEYLAHQTRRAAWFVAAAVVFLVSYMLLSALLCVLVYDWLGSWLWAISSVLIANLLLGLIFLIIALSSKNVPFAEMTRGELKTDLECLKILLNKEKTES